jgi:RimJ/RimL family protein N-acetyltransferase
MTPEIRRLTLDDAPAYRVIRLEGLRDIPEAFGEAYEEALEHEEPYWRETLSGPAVYFGAFDDTMLVGIANFHSHKPRKLAHLGWLYGVYVSPVARGSGAADGLIMAVLEHAKDIGALQVHLGVGAFNQRALRLYERMGFERYGTQPRALRVNGKFIDEHHMVRYLDKNE